MKSWGPSLGLLKKKKKNFIYKKKHFICKFACDEKIKPF